jgi:7-carboxy-7-deazaguanine synthase
MYPVAEIFNAPQGEGRWAGHAMTFLRLAGCNVGRPFSWEERAADDIPIWAERCTDWMGQSFTCDTAYQMRKKMSLEQIFAYAGLRKRICLTGGEPLLHDIKPLLEEAWWRKHVIHIETSGTKPVEAIAQGVNNERLWICVSPKHGYLKEVLDYSDEIKILVGPCFNEEKFMEKFGEYVEQEKVCISPVNGIIQFDKLTANRCLELQNKYPQLRIAVQTHKALGSR